MPRRLADRRRRPIVVVVAVLVALNLGVGGALALAGDAPAPAAAAPTSTTPTTAVPTTTTTAVSLPQPVPSPPDATSEPLVELGTISIPRLGLDATMYEGIAISSIDHGPSHWPGTAMPGHVGNVVLAGHRVTNSRPFRDLDQLVEGDQAVLTTAEGTFVYAYTAGEIVTPDRVDIADQAAGYTATFFACHPPGSARYRIVARWRLVSAPAPGQPDPATLPAA